MLISISLEKAIRDTGIDVAMLTIFQRSMQLVLADDLLKSTN